METNCSIAETTALPFEPSDPHDLQWSPSEIEWIVGRGRGYTYHWLPEKIPPIPALVLPECPTFDLANWQPAE